MFGKNGIQNGETADLATCEDADEAKKAIRSQQVKASQTRKQFEKFQQKKPVGI